MLHELHGYSPNPRRPLLPLKDQGGKKFLAALKDLLELEAEFQASSESPKVEPYTVGR